MLAEEFPPAAPEIITSVTTALAGRIRAGAPVAEEMTTLEVAAVLAI
jgi:hypothetical protein